jgi:hypothetical protein
MDSESFGQRKGHDEDPSARTQSTYPHQLRRGVHKEKYNTYFSPRFVPLTGTETTHQHQHQSHKPVMLETHIVRAHHDTCTARNTRRGTTACKVSAYTLCIAREQTDT